MTDKQPITHKGWRLIYVLSGQPVLKGDMVATSYGVAPVVDGRPPHKPASSGFVQVGDGLSPEYYATVFNMRWLHPDLRPT
jgi:hypothetical protein